MKYKIVGVGPGEPDLITVGALKAIESADLVLMPYSLSGRPSVAEKIVRNHLKDLKTYPIVFPMTEDAEARDSALESRLEELRPLWEKAESVVLPVIGDSLLYATGAYLYEVWKKLCPGLELETISGVSAHSLAASRAGTFMATGDGIMSIIPATAPEERIKEAMASSDCVALYKPSALGDSLEPVVASQKWSKIIKVEKAGMPEEKIKRDKEALEKSEEYLSILLLWK